MTTKDPGYKEITLSPTQVRLLKMVFADDDNIEMIEEVIGIDNREGYEDEIEDYDELRYAFEQLRTLIKTI